MKLKDVLTLGADSVVQLNRLTDELLDVFVNGNPIAKGEIAVQDGRFALRIVELAGSDEVADGSQLEVTRGASVQSGKAAA